MIAKYMIGNIKVTPTQLLKELDLLLKESYPIYQERKDVKESLILKLRKSPFVKHQLSDNSSLILMKDERKLHRLRKYYDSPFPLLSSASYFSNSVGEWNQELYKFGIKARYKYKDLHCEGESGTRVHLIKGNRINTKSNNYLRKQYKRLETYRQRKEISNYWNLCYSLMQHSWSYKLAALNSWQPNWYKTFPLRDLRKMFAGLYKILTNLETKALINNVWIESPKGKWRMLGIPGKAWRLYFHMINQWITYIYSPHLPTSQYDGFLYKRGCKSWWENVLWSDILEKYGTIIELDFSSGFPNISLHAVKRALYEDGLLPSNLINLYLTHLSSTPRMAQNFPTLETYIEHNENLPWRKSCRSVHMGLGISPILFVITLDWSLRKIKFLSPQSTYKWYADDGSLYFTWRGLWNFFMNLPWPSKEIFLTQLFIFHENPILHYLNNHELFQKVGLRICPKKSGIVRLFNVWIKEYKSLGLTYFTNLPYLEQILSILSDEEIPMKIKASTRGRGNNPSKKKLGTVPSNLPLKFIKGKYKLELENLLAKYKPYFGLILAKLYSNNQSLKEPPSTKLHWKSESLLNEMKPHKFNKSLRKQERLNLFSIGSKANELFLKTVYDNLKEEDLPHLTIKKIKRALAINWPHIPTLGSQIPHRDPYTCHCWNASDPSKEYFKKYSELTLSKAELQNYQEAYKQRTELLSKNRN